MEKEMMQNWSEVHGRPGHSLPASDNNIESIASSLKIYQLSTNILQHWEIIEYQYVCLRAQLLIQQLDRRFFKILQLIQILLTLHASYTKTSMVPLHRSCLVALTSRQSPMTSQKIYEFLTVLLLGKVYGCRSCKKDTIGSNSINWRTFYSLIPFTT